MRREMREKNKTYDHKDICLWHTQLHTHCGRRRVGECKWYIPCTQVQGLGQRIGNKEVGSGEYVDDLRYPSD